MNSELKSLVKQSGAYRLLSTYRQFRAWKGGEVGSWTGREFAAPSPHYIKQACILRNGMPEASWVETGTYLGSTTRVLAQRARMVYSIEPEPQLAAGAEATFRGVPNVRILKGTSEVVLPTLLPTISGDLSFWLDGHYSEGVTFKGPKDTPIIDELECIAGNRERFGRLAVLIDDIHLFDPRANPSGTYPPLDFLVDWARANRFHWHIEHDIFVARNF
jgi:hypothetical protein